MFYSDLKDYFLYKGKKKKSRNDLLLEEEEEIIRKLTYIPTSKKWSERTEIRIDEKLR